MVNGTQRLYVEESNKSSVIRVDAKSYDTLKDMAKQEDRSITSVTKRVINQGLQKEVPAALKAEAAKNLKEKEDKTLDTDARDRASDETKLNERGDTYE